LKSLILNGTEIGDEGFVLISSCMNKIEALRIGCTDDKHLTMKGITALANAVADSALEVNIIS